MIRTVAELGINHNGDFATALRLQEVAAECGAWAVKYQIRTNFHECTPGHLWETTRKWRGETLPLFEYRRRLEFSDKQLMDLHKHAKSIGLEWFASPWDRESVHRLAVIERDYCKVASAHVTNYNLLAEIRKAGFPNVFLSCGMSTAEDCQFAADFIKGKSHPHVIPMICTSVYPCPDTLCNVGRVRSLRGYTEYGYSGHETGILPSLYAAVLGASYIERHLTLDKSQDGSDHKSSLEPSGFRELCQRLSDIPSIMGDGTIQPLPEELPAIEKLRGKYG